MRALTPIERAVATYCAAWPKSQIDQPRIARVNPETLTNTTPPDFYFHYIDITSVTHGVIDWASVKQLRFADAPSRARRLLRYGDMMICTVRPLLMSHAALGALEGEPTVCSTGFAVVRSEGGLAPGFLRHLPFAEQVTRQLVAWQCGTNYPAVNERDIRCLIVPVPPLKEQAAIVRILDAVDTALERARAAAERARDLKRALMQDLLPPWIGLRELTAEQMPAGVTEIARADSVADICNGSTPSRTEGRYWRKGTIPWLATGKVHERVITGADEFVTATALRECSIRLLPRGTVLVGMIGQGRTRGMSAYLDVEACINQNFGAFTPKATPRLRVWGKWLFYYLDFHYSRLREIGGGTNQGALNCYLLKRLRFPLPDLTEQKETAAVLDAAESLESAYLARLTDWAAVKRGLMHDLLTGQVRVNDSAKVDPS
jgi:type I restriction enzyme S subunit